MKLDHKSWGFRRDIQINDVLSIDDVVKSVVETIRHVLSNANVQLSVYSKLIFILAVVVTF